VELRSRNDVITVPWFSGGKRKLNFGGAFGQFEWKIEGDLRWIKKSGGLKENLLRIFFRT
jgi:hypothetical protein